ncbi:MAG: hypothetical protein ACK5TA_01005, partial [bacterium]
MKSMQGLGRIILVSGLLGSAFAEQEDVPLMRPDEEKIIETQNAAFNEVIGETIAAAAKSTVRIWGKPVRSRKAEMLAYGTVVGDGKILTKWSEVERAEDSL